MSEKISAVIITLNEASRIAQCIQSVQFADEVVVVDSGSKDDTVAIARDLGARVVEQAWLGYGPQKHFAVERANHHWVYCLDADERVSDKLASSIKSVMSAPSLFAYLHPRRNRFLGRDLFHGEGYPDMSLRLFHKGHAQWSVDSVHEKVIYEGEVGTLNGDLLHASEDGIEAYLNKQNHYTSLQADLLFAAGKQVSVGKLLFSPLLRFIKFYVFKQGFRDGVPGLIHILIGCQNSFTKYAKLIERHRK